MDTRSPEKRSEIMSLVRSKNTAPELLIRHAVFRLGYRYRVHGKNLPGRPDLVFPARRKVIFVHGCFWHGHGCAKGRPPKSRLEYWLPKISENRKRDRRNVARLRKSGWTPLTVWQCQLKSMDKLMKKIQKFLSPSDSRQVGAND